MTQTLGGIAIDERARVLRGDGSPVEALYAAGADAGGISNGGWSSGLAAALVFGRIAAEEALSRSVSSASAAGRHSGGGPAAGAMG